jgi:hypothetical protein
MSLAALPASRLDYIWQWFCKLTGWRQVAMSVGPISHVEIATWAKLMRFRISPAEVECIRNLDLEFRAYLHEKNNPEQKRLPISHQLQAIVDQRDGQRLIAERKAKAAQAAKAKMKK